MSDFPFTTQARRDDIEHGHMVVQEMVKELGAEVATPSGPFVPGTDGDVWTTIAGVPVWNTPTPPVGQEKAYNEFTSSVSITGTTEGGATTVVTASAFTADGVSAYLIEFFAPRVFAPDTGAADSIFFALYDGSGSIGILGEISQHSTTGGSADNVPVFLIRRIIPAAASKTYSIRSWVSSTTGTPKVEAGAGGSGNQAPGFIRITKVT